VTEEEEARGVPRGPEVDDHHAVLGRLHEGFDVATHDDLLLVRQVAHEHRVLDPRAEPLHAPGDATEPAIVADVVGDQVTTTSHVVIYRVTRGS